jgi:hypothetical protein
MKEEKRSKIEDLEKSLYSKSRKVDSIQKKEEWPLDSRKYDVEEDWGNRENLDKIVEENKDMFGGQKKKKSFLKKFFIFSAAFFIVAVAIAVFVIFGGSNIISSENVEISFSGPVSISGGEKLSLQIMILNKNNTNLELADLLIEYPEGTRSATNLSKEMPRSRSSIGDIKSGDLARETIEAVLFGEEGDKKQIKITVEYRVSGSNAIFFKEKVYEVEISSSPVNLSVESLKDINSGKEIDLEVTLSSNSANVINNLMFIAEYPFGFTFNESSPKPSFENNTWKLGDLSPGEERTIKITGKLEGQDNEERIFRFFAGVESEENEREIETAFIVSNQSIFIKKPFVSLDVAVNGSTSENLASPSGVPIGVSIDWQNNLPTRVANVEIEAKLSGESLDRNSVKVIKGFYQSSNNTITWSQENNSAFEFLNPGERGEVGFSFSSLGLSSGERFINSEIFIDISVRGRRLSESDVSEEVDSTVRKKIRISSDLSLSSRALYFSGPFQNTGPMPPKADSTTTYTITWSLANSSNNISETQVIASLPSYVGWLGKLSPSNEDISYNPVSGVITWDVGNLDAGTGFSSPAKEVSFQISLLPSLSQVGTGPIIVGATEITATDDFTRVELNIQKPTLTTRLTTDPSFKSGQGTVVE